MNKSTTAIKIFISSDFLSILYWKIVKHYLYYCFFFSFILQNSIENSIFFSSNFFLLNHRFEGKYYQKLISIQMNSARWNYPNSQWNLNKNIEMRYWKKQIVIEYQQQNSKIYRKSPKIMKYLISILVVLLYFLQNKILNVRKKIAKTNRKCKNA